MHDCRASPLYFNGSVIRPACLGMGYMMAVLHIDGINPSSNDVLNRLCNNFITCSPLSNSFGTLSTSTDFFDLPLLTTLFTSWYVIVPFNKSLCVVLACSSHNLGTSSYFCLLKLSSKSPFAAYNFLKSDSHFAKTVSLSVYVSPLIVTIDNGQEFWLHHWPAS